MKLGATDISAVKIGSTDVNKVYLGANLVWQKVAATLLLDLYPNASAAYSLRKLRTAYAGAAIEVRRSSDNTSQDIGFVDNELDTASLLSFVGAGDGFVSTWYDQSGKGNNITQVTADSQPKIVSLGSINLEGTLPAVDFTVDSKYLDNTNFNNTTEISSVFAIAASPSSLVQVLIDSININNRQIPIFKGGSPNVYAINKGTRVNSSTATNTGLNIHTTVFDTLSDGYLNGVKILDQVNAGSDTRDGFRLGAVYNTGASWQGNILEVIVYDEENKSSDRVAIETNINNYYSIYE